MKKLTTLLIASLISISTNAANWLDLGPDNLGRSESYVDLDSIFQSNNIARAFTKTEYNPSIEVNGISYDEVISLDEFHCNEKPIKSRSLTMRTYLYDKETFSNNIPTDFTYKYPDTSGEVRAKFVCSFKK